MNIREIAFGAALFCAIGTAAGAQEDGNDFEDDLSTSPDYQITYYDVTGDDVEEIGKSMDANGLFDTDDGSHADGLTTWHFTWSWSWTKEPDGTCRVSNVDVKFGATILLPRLVGKPLPEIMARWGRFLARLRVHEAGHADYARAQLPRVVAAVESSDCSGVDAAANAVLDSIHQHDIDYDKETEHGAKQGVRFR